MLLKIKKSQAEFKVKLQKKLEKKKLLMTMLHVIHVCRMAHMHCLRIWR